MVGWSEKPQQVNQYYGHYALMHSMAIIQFIWGENRDQAIHGMRSEFNMLKDPNKCSTIKNEARYHGKQNKTR